MAIKYIGKFEEHKTVYRVKVGKEMKKCDPDTPGAKKDVHEDKRTQLILAFGKKRVVIRKGKEITKEEYDLLSPAAQKKYIDVVPDPKK